MGFWNGSSISWTICKQSAPRCRQITTPAPHYSMFTDQMLFSTPNQQCQSTEGRCTTIAYVRYFRHAWHLGCSVTPKSSDQNFFLRQKYLLKSAHFHRVFRPLLTHRSLGPQTPQPKWHLDWFRCFSTLTVVTNKRTETHRHTNYATHVAISCIFALHACNVD